MFVTSQTLLCKISGLAAAMMWCMASAGAIAAEVIQEVELCRQAAGFDTKGGYQLSAPTADAIAVCERAMHHNVVDVQAYLGRAYYFAKRFEDAKRVISAANDGGSVTAMGMMGVLHGNGYGFVEDRSQALSWYQRAAERGNAIGQVNLSALFSREDEHRDLTKAITWARLAADQGNAVGQVMLAKKYRDGEGVSADNASALAFFRAAAEQGNSDAQVNLASMYKLGLGTPKDERKAFSWYRRAAAQNAPFAQLKVGEYYERGTGGLAVDLKEAASWYRKSAENNNKIAQFNLGNMYDNARGVIRDYGAAAEWYRKSAIQGDADAQLYLGLMYLNGQGVEKDAVQAAHWIEKASAQGNIAAQYERAMLVGRGWQGNPPNSQESLALLTGLREKDDNAYLMWLKLQPVPGAMLDISNREKAGWGGGFMMRCRFLIAAELGGQAVREIEQYLRSKVYSSLSREKKRETVARLDMAVNKISSFTDADLEHLHVLADFGLPGAARVLGRHYQKRGSPRDQTAAVAWFLKSASAGYAKAQTDLGVMYLNGTNLKPDLPKAVSWLRKAAGNSHPDARAQYQLAKLSESGRGIPLDRTAALVWYQTAAADENVDAQKRLGEIYEQGVFGVTDLTISAQWYRRAADEGDAAAQFKLGELYQQGSGLEKNETRAMFWYRRALANGSPEAKSSLALLRKTSRSDEAASALIEEGTKLADSALVSASAHDYLDAAKSYESAADWYLAADRIDDAIGVQVKAIAMREVFAETFGGGENNYFGLLNSSCTWARAGRWAVAHKLPELGLVFAKHSVNRLQQAREQLGQLDSAMRECFLKVHEDRYRWLADLMVDLGQLREAEQVLGMLKHFEVEEYTQRAGRSPTVEKFNFNSREQALLDSAKEAGAEIAAATTLRRLEDIELKQKRKLSAQEQVTKAATIELLRNVQVKLNNQMKGILADLRAANPNVTTDVTQRASELTSAISIQRSLRDVFRRKAVVIQAVVLPHRTHLVLTSADAQKVVTIDVTRTELSRKVAAMRKAVQNTTIESRVIGKELYSLLIAPARSFLSGADTLMISMDDVLRYLPVAALYDGEKYLVEEFSVTNYSPTTRDILVAPAQRGNWQLAAFGSSKAQPKFGFSALREVPGELRQIVREAGEKDGAFPGVRRLDQAFTRVSLSHALRRYPAVHIASHFRLSFGDMKNSVMLLGDGATLPMSDLTTNAIDFGMSYVDLLTLSACETAIPIGLDTATGAEIESLSSLIHKAGARSVIATLWPVSDSATTIMMGSFYRNLARSTKMSKAGALRKAQIEFIRSGRLAKTSQKTFLKPDLSHPYYWAPYTLLGNWL
ncbi:CHAT domain-containing protein [Duganella sp. CT11-25]|uniref:CHAT domain-containing protein n=1 Tax=unclassified Duganella TaxID=2636909 RepID=UPI0039AFC149